MTNDTSWHNVADWYQKVPKDKDSNHQTLIIPGLKRLCSKYLFKGAKIMDLACGEGTVTHALSESGFAMTGCDLAESLIIEAQKQYPDLKFTVVDAAQPDKQFLYENMGQFDAVICVLALQNIRKLKTTFLTVANLLKSKGYFIFVINHPSFRIPKSSFWQFKGNSKQQRVIEKYMTEHEIPITTHPGTMDSPETSSFHRPLEVFAKSLQAQNLAIVDLEEWVSTKQSEPGPRAKAENTARHEIPLFMTVVTKKLN